MPVPYRFVSLVLLLEYIHLPLQASQDERPKVLQLVAMVSESSSGTRPTQDWERGLEILPGARVAVQEVNRNTDILPGYQLELVELITEECSGSLALVQLVEHLVSQAESEGERESQTVGIIGPLCNDAAELIATITGHPAISLPQIAAAPSDLSDDRSKHRYLFQMLPLSQAYINTVFGLMSEFGWSNLAVLCIHVDQYNCRVATTFEEEVSNKNIEIVYSFQATPIDHKLMSISNTLRESGAKIILAFLSPSLASELVCGAYMEGLTWPEYGWILPGLRMRDFEGNTFCDSHTMALATEGLLLLEENQYEPEDPSTELVSGQNYSTYYSSYIDELMETANRTGRDLHSNLYASVFYDSFWAFALALNQSNIQFQTEFPYRDNELARNITTALLNLSFNGSTGQIEFDGNHDRRYVAILVNQVWEGTSIIAAYYDPISELVTINHSWYVSANIPNDELSTIYVPPSFLVVVLHAAFYGLAVVLTSVMLSLYIYYRNEPEVKATSTTLSLLIFVGCYLRLTSSILMLVFDVITVRGHAERIITCQLELWLEVIGRVLIIATLAVRLLRIYRVFTHFGRTGKLYSDRALSTLVLGIELVPMFILLLWAIIDVYTRVDVTTYNSESLPPYYEVQQYCDSEYTQLWGIGISVYCALLSVMPLTLAFKTRKISRTIYKDTKTVFALLTAITFVAGFAHGLSVVFQGDPIAQRLFITAGYTIIVYLCQFFLFLPKTLPPLWRQLRELYMLRTTAVESL